MQNHRPQAENRRIAGILLAQKLATLDLYNAVVVGVPHGGVCVAAEVADYFHLPLDVMMCRKISDPSDQSKTIGSVSRNEVVMHDQHCSIPQDYLYFQTIRLKNEIKLDNDFYYAEEPKLDFEFKTVILVDDFLSSADTLLACVRDIRKKRALKIIVAVPFVQSDAATIIRREADDLVFLRMQQSIHSPTEYYSDFPEVKEWTVRDLLRRSRLNFVTTN
jgi:predicted phosphoribosyltransferase